MVSGCCCAGAMPTDRPGRGPDAAVRGRGSPGRRPRSMSMPPLPWPQIRHAATGRYGQEVFRHLDKVMLHAVGVADSKADKPRPKGGSDLVILPR